MRAPKTGSNGCNIDVDVWPVINASAGEANNVRIGTEFRLEVSEDSGMKNPDEGSPRVAKGKEGKDSEAEGVKFIGRACDDASAVTL